MATDKDTTERTKFEPPEKLIDAERQRKLVRGLELVVLALLLVYVVFPVYWSVTSAFKSIEALFADPAPIIFFDPILDNFQRVLFETNFPIWYRNSIIVAIMATILSTGLAALAGYGLTRANFRGQRTLARSILFVYMFPPILLAIPLYVLFFKLQVLNSYFALALGHAALALPFATWIMWQYFQTIPMEFEESAWISGAGRIRAVWDIVLPMARPGLIAIAIINFSFSWNDFTMAVTLMTEGSKKTFPVGVNQFIELTAVHWGLVNASSVLIMLPAFLLVVFLQRYILLGFGATEL